MGGGGRWRISTPLPPVLLIDLSHTRDGVVDVLESDVNLIVDTTRPTVGGGDVDTTRPTVGGDDDNEPDHTASPTIEGGD